MSSVLDTPCASWYLLQTKPKQEFRALEQLENQGYTCYLPTLPAQKLCRGKLTTVDEPLFARYLFIRLDRVSSNWFPIRSTRGVSKIVAFGEHYATLPDDCVIALQNTHPAPLNMFEPGQRVAVTSGPFAGLEGVFEMTNGEERAMVLIEFMSQPQKVMFAIEALQKAA